jgi:PadR family transcriptional regulator PadR
MQTILANLKKAVIELLILKFLSAQDMYGYQIAEEFQIQSNHQFLLLEGSMYPLLHRLESMGCIFSYYKPIGERQKRVYYHLTSTGRTYLQELITEYRETIRIIDFLIDSNEGDLYNEH